jgi:hypothetical protein
MPSEPQATTSPSVPRVLFLGKRDDANLCNRAARAINALAGERRARVWTLDAHPYGYTEDMIGDDEPGDLDGTQWDWLISTGDGDHQALMRMLGRFDGRASHVAMTHSGSSYRGNPHHYNRVDAVCGATVRFIGADSLHLADANIPAVPWFSTCDGIMPTEEPSSEGECVVVSHSPSDRAKKGTAEILERLEMERADIARDRAECLDGGWEGAPPAMAIDLIEGVSYTEARARRARSHIFIDQLNPQIGGFGASAVEAMAQGCAVIADIRNVPDDRTWSRFGLECPPIIEVRSAEDMEGEIDRLLKTEGDLYLTRKASLEWAREYAAPLPFARYFLRMLEQHS